MDVKNQYDVIGKDYIKGQKEYFSKREGDARIFLKKFLIDLKGKKVLDLACGHGEDILMCEKLGADVYGLDVSSTMIKEASKIVKNPQNLRIGEIENIDFRDKTFDIVISRFGLNNVVNLEKAFNEISRVLKKGGMLVVITSHPFKDVVMQNKKIYGKREIIEMKLYKNKVKIHFPTHTLGEYFSSVFLKNFDLQEIEEGKSNEGDEEDLQIASPGFFGFMAVKR